MTTSKRTDEAIEKLTEVGMGTKDVVTPEIRAAWKEYLDAIFPEDDDE